MTGTLYQFHAWERLTFLVRQRLARIVSPSLRRARQGCTRLSHALERMLARRLCAADCQHPLIPPNNPVQAFALQARYCKRSEGSGRAIEGGGSSRMPDAPCVAADSSEISTD